MNHENMPTNLPPQGNTTEDEIDLLDLIGVLFKHKLLIIGITGLAAVFILIYSIISLKLPAEKSYLPNFYTPKSLVIINDSSSGGGLSSMLNSSGLGSLAALAGVSGGGSSNSALAEKLAKSNTMVDILGAEFKLAEIYETQEAKFPVTELRAEIRKKLTLVADESTGTMEIGFEDIDRDLATKITNRTVELLENEFIKIDAVSNQSQKTLLERKIADVELEIENLEKEYVDFQSRYGILDAEVMAESFTTQVMTIKTQIINLDAEISSLNTTAGRENPMMAERFRSKQALMESLRVLEEEGAYGLPSMKEMSSYLIENERLKREIQVQAAIYLGVLQQYEMIKLSDRGTGPTFQVIELAEVPEMKSDPSRGKLCVIVTMAAFFLSIFAAFLIEFWQNLKQDPERMKKLRGEV
ncbi:MULTISPECIES: hypothetical protein [unclassified Oceanispirochaeta]|uniref:hypothetical protein n=1 Tax=unclassified Oceanispirochaeta TaxID=2635722 RepID=UPI0011C04331|nr:MULTISPECIES: hypothetical protein [unclassified Oceanispirochaeta]MBF9016497.1 hypothetical protein [Oceanispirochaeta sp. M2]NPD72959.1 hypothetical protein [Oceanispirochaeta sp. M1]